MRIVKPYARAEYVVPKRWTAQTKQQLVILCDWLGVNGYVGATDIILARNSISHEELQRWREQLKNKGLPGLKVTNIQQDRVFA